ncbi:MAG TPA: tRNA lysidine(34) synthetase TilS [Conexibacter sp.]|nr:tRNA lysidine(34) synthetase TilS [Conexibacter sp.]
MEADRVLEQVRAGGLLPAGGPVVVLLSGGRDSVCLLDVAVRLADDVRAVHVNYGLRDEAPDDERHCVELCERLGVALSVERPRRPEAGGNVQAWARDVRYAVATSLALEAGSEAPGVVAAGHTADDQVETILYRLASSPSRRALLGMRPRDGLLVRPLLGVTRAQTTAYCAARGLAWRDDVTNGQDRYARNRVRNELVPALAQIHPAAAENVLRTAALLRDEGEVLDALVGEQLDERGGRLEIPLERLAALPPALRRLVVQRLADGAAGKLVPGAAKHAEEVAALRRTGRALLDLGGGVRAVAERGVLHAERGSGRHTGARA